MIESVGGDAHLIHVSLSIVHCNCCPARLLCMQRSTSLALVVRICIALFTRTFFQPDEYFQSLEVAHHLVFGYGHLTWEWLSAQPIRSIVYPILNAPIYWLLEVLGLDHTKLLVDLGTQNSARSLRGYYGYLDL